MTEQIQKEEGHRPPPKVSVAMTTFNHADYVEQAIRSVMSQEAAFEYELLVGDDFSTDGTRDIVVGLQAEYPGRIVTILPEANLGNRGMALFRRVLDRVQGGYIAWLDGDDYWTSPEKLQIQADYMDARPECSMCFHDAEVEFPDGTWCDVRYTPTDQKEFSTVNDLWKENFIASCSPLFRRNSLLPLPAWYETAIFGDWPLYVLAALHGPIGYLKQTMAVYRYHGRGAWSHRSQTEQLEATILSLTHMGKHLDARFQRDIARSVGRRHFELAAAYARQGHRRIALRNLMAGLKQGSPRDLRSAREAVTTLMKRPQDG